MFTCTFFHNRILVTPQKTTYLRSGVQIGLFQKKESAKKSMGRELYRKTMILALFFSHSNM